MPLTMEVIIPTYRPDEKLRALLDGLQTQTLLPDRVTILNTGEEYWPQRLEKDYPFLQVRHIPVSDFDHGGTRHEGALSSKAQLLLFMTQDAIPADEHLIESLSSFFQRDPRLGAVYARQLPRTDCRSPERETRAFNYSDLPHIYGQEDVAEHGIKTYFCSNVCAAYRASIYRQVGGFPTHTIFNEDMIYVGHMVQQGFLVGYCPQARVVHSHNYSALQQLHRNFDLGVSQRDYPEVFESLSSEGEGLRYVKTLSLQFLKKGRLLPLLRLILHSGAKYTGYLLGKHYLSLPGPLVLWCTSNKGYWRRENKRKKEEGYKKEKEEGEQKDCRPEIEDE